MGGCGGGGISEGEVATSAVVDAGFPASRLDGAGLGRDDDDDDAAAAGEAPRLLSGVVLWSDAAVVVDLTSLLLVLLLMLLTVTTGVPDRNTEVLLGLEGSGAAGSGGGGSAISGAEAAPFMPRSTSFLSPVC